MIEPLEIQYSSEYSELTAAQEKINELVEGYNKLAEPLEPLEPLDPNDSQAHRSVNLIAKINELIEAHKKRQK